MPGTFSGSAFVSQTVGVDNVCERAALAACRKEDKEKIKQPGCGSEGKENRICSKIVTAGKIRKNVSTGQVTAQKEGKRRNDACDS